MTDKEKIQKLEEVGNILTDLIVEYEDRGCDECKLLEAADNNISVLINLIHFYK